MKLMRIALLSVFAAPLAACGGGFPAPDFLAQDSFGGTVHPEAAGVRADGSLVPGRGKPDAVSGWSRSSAEVSAESKMIETDAPYGVSTDD